jgi:GMP synthase-like glutamine amidotransferase
VRALLIAQDHFSPAGPVGERLVDRGYDLEELLVVPAERFTSPDVEATFPDPTAYDLIVPMGAVWSADDEARIGRWLLPERELLRRAHANGVPMLGICFGGQALAVALGGGVERAPRAEIGWVEVESDDPDLIESGPWFQFHYDRWTLPPGAVEIARNGVASQAFVIGRSLGLQFHPELTSTTLAAWMEFGGREEVVADGQDPYALLARTRTEDAPARERAHRLVDRFLNCVAGVPV